MHEGATTTTDDLPNLIHNGIIIIFFVGAVSVVYFVIRGLKYVMSNGDQSAVTSAKNTILFAAIGIVVTVAAYAFVKFVVDKI